MPPLLAALPGWVGQLILVGIAVAVFIAFFAAARWVRDAAGRWLVRRGVGGDALMVGRRAVYVALLVAGALIAVTVALGTGNAALGGLVLATIVAAFGVQDVLANYVSGYYVLLERHIRPGDRITLSFGGGVVEDIRLRVTLLRGDDGRLVVVPNSILFNQVVTVAAPSRRPLADGPEDHPAESVEAGGVEV